jgi:L-ascorbate metabolism protein UlaG (beta-lactamase superfamily)
MKILRRIVKGLFIAAGILVGGGYLFMLQASFGKSPSGERLERIKKSAHYQDGIFKNLVETPMYPKGVSFWKMTTVWLWGKDKNNEPSSTLPAVKERLRNPPTTTKPTVTWFGHSTVLLQMAGKNILTDPNFSERASPVSYAGPKAFKTLSSYSVSDLPDLDVVLISHDHYDHLDYNSILQLKSKTKFFIVPLGVASHLAHWGIPLEQIKEKDWWEESVIDPELKIILTPSRHFSGRGLSFNKTFWGSYVIEVPGHRVFFSGDSGYSDHFKMIGEKYGPFDLAMIETGQYHDYWPNIHMKPENSVQAAVDLKAKVLLPVHWAKFALALHAWDEPIKRDVKKAHELKMPLLTPTLGQRTEVDSLKLNYWWE